MCSKGKESEGEVTIAHADWVRSRLGRLRVVTEKTCHVTGLSCIKTRVTSPTERD